MTVFTVPNRTPKFTPGKANNPVQSNPRLISPPRMRDLAPSNAELKVAIQRMQESPRCKFCARVTSITSRTSQWSNKGYNEVSDERVIPLLAGARVFPEAQPREWAASATARWRGWAITGIRVCIAATNPLGWPVIIVQVRSHFWVLPTLPETGENEW
jgi:hypothetical protein